MIPLTWGVGQVLGDSVELLLGGQAGAESEAGVQWIQCFHFQSEQEHWGW